MENYTSGQIREEFMTPLMILSADFAELAKSVDRLAEAKKTPAGYLPLNVASARKGIGFLKKLKREIERKIAEIEEGTFLWRENELRKRREEYRATKITEHTQQKRSHKK